MKQWSESSFVGGHPALDFVNTVGNQDKARTQSDIAHWGSFTAWAAASQLFSGADVRALKAVTVRARQDAVLDEVHTLRETAHAVLSKLAASAPPARGGFAALQAHLGEALGRASLERGAHGFSWHVGRTDDDPAWITDRLALCIEDLLRSADVARIRECGRCTWLFIDRGRGRGRRWCDMRTCGNRAKAEAFRKR